VGTGSYRFWLGAFECVVVNDGVHAARNPAPKLFANASEERLRQVLSAHDLNPTQWQEHVSGLPCMVLSNGNCSVLIDTGAGDLLPAAGELIPKLRAEGIAPGSIDTVILTHGHGDHVGGNLTRQGKPTFPNARYVMWKDEWDFWFSDTAEARASKGLVSMAREKLKPIEGQLSLPDRDTEIVSGIRVVSAPGHTPGHMAVVISSNHEQLLCISDAALHPIHLLQPDWYSAVDVTPDQALATRRRLLEWAVAKNALVQAFHFPFPGLGHVIQKGDAWQWQPIGGEGKSSAYQPCRARDLF
jgi:glyoxylase-like metal-dependent hydrolase (beta-lactamase superfamily II)